jgi:hypothetical protein
MSSTRVITLDTLYCQVASMLPLVYAQYSYYMASCLMHPGTDRLCDSLYKSWGDTCKHLRSSNGQHIQILRTNHVEQQAGTY